jgi:hypothetical protein
MTDKNISFSVPEVANYYAERVPELKHTSGPEWRGPCPIHNGERDSFAVDPKTGRWFCHSECGRGGGVIKLEMELAGCDFKTAKAEVYRIIGRPVRSAQSGSTGVRLDKLAMKHYKKLLRARIERFAERKGLRHVCNYRYRYPDGRLAYVKAKFRDADGQKTFLKLAPTADGGLTTPKEAGIQPMLYNLHLLAEAAEIHLCNGEKAANAGHKLGLITTCLPDGEGNWDSRFTKSFTGKRVVAYLDNDAKGEKQGNVVARALFGHATEIRLVRLPNLPRKGDLWDWIRAGGTSDELRTIITETPVVNTVPELEARQISPDSGDAAGQRKSHATALVELATTADLFHTPDGEAYAGIEVADHREIWRLKAPEFKRWLAAGFFEEFEKAPSSTAINDALGVLEGKAIYEGPEYGVFTRLAQADGSLYLDLGNATWEAVRITASGWRLVKRPKIRFRRPRGMQALPQPTLGGSIEDLREFVNVRNLNDWRTLVAWLIGTFQFGGPFPVLVLQGEQGSAKSTAARLLRSLIDPNKTMLRSHPREVRDLMIAAKNGWLVAFDNISSLPTWLSDALCSLATGGGFSTRELYSDDQEALFDATRPILLNGIDGVVVRGDLLDRSLVLELPAIPPKRRKSEHELWNGFRAAQPGILGALLTAVAGAMRERPTTKLPELPRMADFTLWATAAESTLGWPGGTVVSIVNRNQTDTSTLPLEASPIMPALRRLLKRDRTFKGTATDLLRQLGWSLNGERNRHPYDWPRTPHALSCGLHRLAPNLRAAGVQVTFQKTPGAGSQRIIMIEDQSGNFSDATDACDANGTEE